MPIFRVTATEEVKRTVVAYVDAPDAEAADAWASEAPDTAFKVVGDETDVWSEVKSIEPVEAPPRGWRVNGVAA